jgi:hypothetical protein
MGLDMYAYAVKHDIKPVDDAGPKDAEREELAYWRKHPNLHGWMEQRYRTRDGKDEAFNCAYLRLWPEDIDDLEKDVFADALPFTEGFFFGRSLPEDKHRDLEFIEKAREKIGQGYSVYYTSWW